MFPTSDESFAHSASVEAAFSDTNRDAPLLAVVDRDAACDRCGYNIRGLSRAGDCPECGHPIARSMGHEKNGHTRADRRWATLVLLGIVLLLLSFPSQIFVVAHMSFEHMTFGTAPKLNVPGPKVWAVPMVQRSIGYRPEELGANGMWFTLCGALATFLITTPPRRLVEASTFTRALAFAARWAPPALIGGFLGFLLNAEGTYSAGDVAQMKYSTLGIAAVELPATALLLGYLAHICRDLRLTSLQHTFVIVTVVTAVLQVAAIVMAQIAPSLDAIRRGILVQGFTAVYESACVLVALLTIVTMVRLGYELALQAMPGRMKAWLD